MFNRLLKYLKAKKVSLSEMMVYFLSLTIFLINTSYVSYPDEFSNLMGAAFITQGKIPFRDFFNHHMPLPWYLGALILIFSRHSYIVFRFIWTGICFLSLTFLGFWIKRNSAKLYGGYLFFLLMYPLAAVYFWLHLYLADSLAVLFFSLIFCLLLTQTGIRKVRFKIIVLCSLLTFCLVMTSLTYIYVGLVFYLWQLYLLRYDFKKITRYFFISALPFVLYLIYLLGTKSLQDFYFANFRYNTDFYIDIPNFNKGRLFNPLKFGFTLIYNFWGKYLSKLTTIKDLNLYLPIGMTAILGSFVLLLFFFSRKIGLGLIFFLLLSFSAPRGNLQEFRETDYQIGVFLLMGVISSVYFLIRTGKNKLENILLDDAQRLVRFILGVFIFFSFIFLLKNTYEKWYLRYTQKMPSIIDKSYAADFLDEILQAGDYYWIGPYEPHEEFFVKKARIPGKFYIMLPQYSESDLIKRNFIKGFAKNPPKVIIFKTDTGIFGTPTYEFGSFLLDWMKGKYILLHDIKGIEVLKNPTSLKLGLHLYIRNSSKNEVVKELKKYGYIR